MQETINVSMVPLRGMVALPKVPLHFDVGREKSMRAIEHAAENATYVFLVLQKDIEEMEPNIAGVNRVGTLCKIKQVLKLPGDHMRALVEGVSEAKIHSIIKTEPYYIASVEVLEKEEKDDDNVNSLFRNMKNLTQDAFALGVGKYTSDIKTELNKITNARDYLYFALNSIFKSADKKQEILAISNIEKKIEKMLYYLTEEIEIAKIDKKISSKVRQNIDKGQREYYLREQIKVIHEELEEDSDEILKLTEQIKAKGLPQDSEEKVLKELTRMGKMALNSPDANVIRTYVEWILELPFNVESNNEIDFRRAQEILDEDHYGLEKVKERILEFMAVRKLTESQGATILCFVGPPGVGKTSIVKSIARALNKKYVRMSLGGVRDEAEIRGHRRTYIGAMPGRILYHMRNACVVNPVFLLDEIDKMSSDFRGDPASSLLEVLDPEQNENFRDHFLEIPYDLSKVMFIATANDANEIPEPLLDRMEVIYLSGYTDEEKLQIAKRYLVPKRAKINGLLETETLIEDDAIINIIENYTMEAGVRNLEREIDSVLRKQAKIFVESDESIQPLTVKDVEISDLLGAPKYQKDEVTSSDMVGTVTGLAWTSVGGSTLNIEVALMKGKGEIIMTGQLGDIMKESARAAISYIHSMAAKYHINEKMFSENDVHIHIPEGAVPKDGPSAGVTLATAILSAFTNKPVRHDIAMTGEITLRGNVLAIGGLKEKSLAAYRAGIGKIIIPSKNEKDLKDLPKSILQNVEYIPVNNVHSVFENAIVGGV